MKYNNPIIIISWFFSKIESYYNYNDDFIWNEIERYIYIYKFYNVYKLF